jgi:FKBP-type peptidyl-prolyl cis-trans isomerase 2
MSEYKFSKKVLEEQGFEAKVGNEVDLKLGEIEIKAKITKIDGDQVYAVGEETQGKS